MNEKKLFIINPYYLGIAKAAYKGGRYANANNSVFIRAVIEDVAKLAKKAVKK